MCLSEVLKAKDVIQNLHHEGENPPHMHWKKPEQLLDDTHSAVRRQHSAECHPEEMKIQSSLKKIEDPDPEHIHPVIIQRQEDRLNCTHLQAMADIKKDVVRRHPNGDDNNENARRGKQTTAKKHQSHKHQNDGSQNHSETQRFKPRTIPLKNGKKIKCHDSHQMRTSNHSPQSKGKPSRMSNEWPIPIPTPIATKESLTIRRKN